MNNRGHMELASNLANIGEFDIRGKGVASLIFSKQRRLTCHPAVLTQ
jgi:hypothetical protein